MQGSTRLTWGQSLRVRRGQVSVPDSDPDPDLAWLTGANPRQPSLSSVRGCRAAGLRAQRAVQNSASKSLNREKATHLGKTEEGEAKAKPPSTSGQRRAEAATARPDHSEQLSVAFLCTKNTLGARTLPPKQSAWNFGERGRRPAKNG